MANLVLRKLYRASFTLFFLLTTSLVIVPQTSRVHAINEPCVGRTHYFGSISISGGSEGRFDVSPDVVSTYNFTGKTMEVTLGGVQAGAKYEVALYTQNVADARAQSGPVSIAQNGHNTFDLALGSFERYLYDNLLGFANFVSMDLKVKKDGVEICQIADINVLNYQISCSRIEVQQTRDVTDPNAGTSTKQCLFNASTTGMGCLEGGKTIDVVLRDVKFKIGDPFPSGRDLVLNIVGGGLDYGNDRRAQVSGGDVRFASQPMQDRGRYTLEIADAVNDRSTDMDRSVLTMAGACADTKALNVAAGCQANECSTTVANVDPDQQRQPGETQFGLCKQISVTGPTSNAYQKCVNCFDKKGIWTAVGCIYTQPQSIIQAVVRIGLGIGGGIALLMTLVGGFMLTTSQGDPKQMQEGKDMITSAIIGIIFVLFSVVILQFIGVTVLQLPGFGKIK